MSPPISVGIFVAAIIVSAIWRQRRDIARAWHNRRLFSLPIFWGIAALYSLSGAAITFASFGAVRLALSSASTTMQAVAITGLVALPCVHLVARKLATPIFNRDGMAQRDRYHFHSLWMGFWVLGLALGLLPFARAV
jgi:hypothetical protein